ncbi:Gfo/Idh/MocA family protein [Bythopirellula polymerisocia]|uniref:Glucose--fructose oxidoreductase n=1 Tax=Bythopirellula polymerisocia TaxID=2528003 RepID=A0A5C6CS75_9BACT|nr:Gfo/Idh/MocA family oxidoreductase [Bythopirellula polymerisocia]TWU27362.1 Glucose--fructose oxidoreductase precursor [Bythopirellula polymerisocia]
MGTINIMLKVGIAGIGFMGMIHYLSYQKIRGAKVVAICEKNPLRLTGDWRGIQGNFGPAGTLMDLSGVATYSDVDEMLANEQIDAVDITLPPSLHEEVAVKSLRAGKHVFCEKPMALTPAACRRMSAAAEKAGRTLLVGHVLPFFPEYSWALKAARSGRYGKLLGGNFKRVIADPSWLANFWQADQVGGPMLDLHVHDAHFIRLLFGMPEAVSTTGRTKNDLAEYWHSHFDYGTQGPVVQATSGTIPQQGRQFLHGFEIHLEKATMLFEFAVTGDKAEYLCPPTLLRHNGKVDYIALAGEDPQHAFEAELREVVRSISSGETSKILDAQLALDAIVLCNKQAESLRKRRVIKL